MASHRGMVGGLSVSMTPFPLCPLVPGRVALSEGGRSGTPTPYPTSGRS